MQPQAQLRPAPDRDVKAFRELLVPLLDDAYVFARYLTRSATEAEDLVQDAFLRALEYFGSFRGGDPRPWLLTIVRNCHRAAAHKPGRREIPLSVVAPDDAPVLEAGQPWSEEQDDPERILLAKDAGETVHRALAELPDAFREAIVLREIHELTYQQIAEVTDVPIGTVMSRLARARDLLRQALYKRLKDEKVRNELR